MTFGAKPDRRRVVCEDEHGPDAMTSTIAHPAGCSVGPWKLEQHPSAQQYGLHGHDSFSSRGPGPLFAGQQSDGLDASQRWAAISRLDRMASRAPGRRRGRAERPLAARSAGTPGATRSRLQNTNAPGDWWFAAEPWAGGRVTGDVRAWPGGGTP